MKSIYFLFLWRLDLPVNCFKTHRKAPLRWHADRSLALKAKYNMAVVQRRRCSTGKELFIIHSLFGEFFFSYNYFIIQILSFKCWESPISVAWLQLLSLPLRSDKTLQDIVYKLVPGLFKSKSTAAAISVTTRVYFHSDSAVIFSAVSSWVSRQF